MNKSDALRPLLTLHLMFKDISKVPEGERRLTHCSALDLRLFQACQNLGYKLIGWRRRVTIASYYLTEICAGTAARLLDKCCRLDGNGKSREVDRVV